MDHLLLGYLVPLKDQHKKGEIVILVVSIKSFEIYIDPVPLEYLCILTDIKYIRIDPIPFLLVNKNRQDYIQVIFTKKSIVFGNNNNEGFSQFFYKKF